MTTQRTPILVEGESCWRLARASRAAVLVDAADYFGALRSAVLKAKRSIFIVGWDIDSRASLCRSASDMAPDGAPDALCDLLTYAVEHRPDLEVHLLLWDYSMVYSLERELLPSLHLDWRTPKRVKVCLDGVLPLGGCHHQKIVVVDDSVAFCGGLDLTIRRWDTRDHRPGDPRRRDPEGEAYAPFHDVQMVVDGEAARALGETVRQRWRDASCQKACGVAPAGDPWPDGVEPHFHDVEVGIARTLPKLNGRGEVREIEALYLRSIAAAEGLIYIENQYLTTDSLCQALIERMQARPELEVVVVGPRQANGWLEEKSMGVRRLRFMRRLEAAGVAERVRLLYPWVGQDDDRTAVMVHAKVMVVDDRLLHIGSSNLNNRSMGLDTECDLAIEAAGDTERRAVAAIRDDLLAEHLGTSAEAVATALARQPTIAAALSSLAGTERGLSPVEHDPAYDDELAEMLGEVADADGALAPADLLEDPVETEAPARGRGRLWRLGAGAAAVIALLLAWKFTPLSEFTDIDRIEPWVGWLRDHPWAPMIVPAFYLLGGLVGFPVLVMITLTALTFGPWLGFVYALAGSLLSAAALFQIGVLAGGRTLQSVMGQRLTRIRHALAKRGIVTIAVVRLTPIAPFTLVNLVAGAAHLRFRDYMVGTVVGMAPGIVLMTALGDRLRHLWENPEILNFALLAVIIALWLGLGYGLQMIINRRTRAAHA